MYNPRGTSALGLGICKLLQSFQKATEKYSSRTLKMLRPLNPIILLLGTESEEIFRDKG